MVAPASRSNLNPMARHSNSERSDWASAAGLGSGLELVRVLALVSGLELVWVLALVSGLELVWVLALVSALVLVSELEWPSELAEESGWVQEKL